MKNAQDPAEQNPNTAPLPRLRLEPRRGALLAGHDNTLDVLVRIEAPSAPSDAPTRPPLSARQPCNEWLRSEAAISTRSFS